MLARRSISAMSVARFGCICWPGFQFLQGPWHTSAEYAGQAFSSWDVCGTLLLNMLTRFRFLGCLWHTSAQYDGQASDSCNVRGTLLLNMIVRLSMPAMSVAHFCRICWPGLPFLERLWQASAEYAGQARFLKRSWHTFEEYAGQAFDPCRVRGTLLLNMLARSSIPGMSVARFC